MRVKASSCLFLFSLLLVVFSSKAPKLFAQTEIDSLVFDPLKRGKAVVPFELINNLAVIELRINDSPKMKFIVDSGVSRTIISELPEDGKITLSRVNKVALRGLGGEQLIYGYRSPGNEIQIGSARGLGAEVIILERDLLQLSNLMGTYVHGIIGFDLFNAFIVEFDYAQRIIVLYERDNKRKINQLKRSRLWHEFPLEVEETKSYTYMNLYHGKQSEPQKLRLLLDTGSSGALTLFATQSQGITIPESTQSGLLGIGLGGEIYGDLGRVHKTSMKPFAFRQPVVAYPDSNYSQILNVSDRRNGSIGSDILRRFKVLYDYKGKNLLMRKNKFYREDFTYNRSGVDISTPYPSVPVYIVSKVREGSEAQKMGLQKGDQIDRVHGKATVNMNLSEVLEYFRVGRKGRIQLDIKRDSLNMSLQFKLDELLKIDPK